MRVRSLLAGPALACALAMAAGTATAAASVGPGTDVPRADTAAWDGPGSHLPGSNGLLFGADNLVQRPEHRPVNHCGNRVDRDGHGDRPGATASPAPGQGSGPCPGGTVSTGR
ncbi:chaplin family protein [Streptomyces sp. DH12]|uniref:chaplin family protein n=1 Tax=Streptomyces sp. DH12 TaxID=2857010 RepID=UPI001E4DBFEB|nr:chaplin family protein [Streptomyces sp. DH12]